MAVTAGVSAPQSVQISGQTVALSAQDKVTTSGTTTTVVASSDDGGGIGSFLKNLLGDTLKGAGNPVIGQGVDLANKGLEKVPGVGSAVKAGQALTSGVGSMAAAILDPVFWERIGIGALGFFLILIGVVFMVESNKTARSLTEMAVVA